MKKKCLHKKPKLMILVSLILLILVSVQLIVSHHLATLGGKLRQLEIKTVQLEQENRLLAEKISGSGSLARISLKAQELGFVRTTAVLHLTPQIPVALK